jgi:hypothetical protein
VTSVPVEGSRIIAAMTPPISKAPFNRGRLILRASDGTIVHAQTYTSDGRAEGPVLTEEELRRLIETEHATAIPVCIPAIPGALLWVLRPNLPRRDRALAELQMSGILVHSPMVGQKDSRLCVVEERRAQSLALRDRWRDEAIAAAKVHAERGDWARAMVDAEIAHAVSRGLDPEVLGFLSLAYEKCGETAGANGLLVMARRSRGTDFEAQVVSAREHFQETLTSHATTPTQSATDLFTRLQAALLGFPAAVTETLGKRHGSRLIPIAA